MVNLSDDSLEQLHVLIKKLRKVTKKLPPTLTKQIINIYGKNPYLILTSCLISLRTRDSISIKICKKLFAQVVTPEQMVKIPQEKLEKILFKAGFYKNKAKTLKSVAQIILSKFKGKVPSTPEGLSSISGIGHKTTALVLAMAFDIPSICVDTHVHRLSNLFGLVRTKTPEATKSELEKILPQEFWTEWNNLLVIYGQHILKPNTKTLPKCEVVDLVLSKDWPFAHNLKDFIIR